MAFVGLEASVITVFVLRILLDNFFPIILAKVEAFSTGSYSTNLSQTERKYIYFCLSVCFLLLPVIQGFKRILLQDQRMFKGFFYAPIYSYLGM